MDQGVYQWAMFREADDGLVETWSYAFDPADGVVRCCGFELTSTAWTEVQQRRIRECKMPVPTIPDQVQEQLRREVA